MMDIQVIVTDGIVLVAAYFVVRRIWDQVSALRKPNCKPGATICDTCGGCEPAKRPADSQLIGLSTTAPKRVPMARESLPEHLRRLTPSDAPNDPASKN